MSNTLPVRVYQTENLIMLAAPMPGLEPQDIRVTIEGNHVTVHGDQRGPRQHRLDLLRDEWTIGPYHREIQLPEPVDGMMTNVSYGNGVLALAMPKVSGARASTPADFRLTAVDSTHGERIGHVGHDIRPAGGQAHRPMAAY